MNWFNFHVFVIKYLSAYNAYMFPHVQAGGSVDSGTVGVADYSPISLVTFSNKISNFF